MSSFTELPSEKFAILSVIDPDANAAGALTGDWADMSKFEQAAGILLSGTFGTNGTLDFKLQQATDSSGTGAKDITGKAATQLTHAGSGADKQVVINVRAEELDIENGFKFVAPVMTTATATGDSAAMLIGLNPKTSPASDNDLASVNEIVT